MRPSAEPGYNWKSDEYESLMDQAAAAADIKQRYKLMGQAERILNDYSDGAARRDDAAPPGQTECEGLGREQPRLSSLAPRHARIAACRLADPAGADRPDRQRYPPDLLSFIARRVLGAIPTLFALATISFFIMRVAPGSPFSSNRKLSKFVIANIEKRYNRDDPLWLQFVRYLWGVVRLDFGPR
jgi:hypothetical protein